MIENSSLLTQYDENIRTYKSFEAEIEHLVKSVLQASQINCNAITSRLKTRESLAEKIERKQGKYTSISDITDIVGVRIITYYSEDVDKIAEIIESEFDVDEENTIDKRESLEPDRFGYCSVHYVVKMSSDRLALREYKSFEGMKCEIQIRSVLQHAWAEIEHDIGYKSEITLPKQMRRKFSRIAGLLEIADQEFDQIRQALTEYKNNAQAQIENEDFLDHELDAVILQVMLKSNKNILDINKHISGLVKENLVEVNGDEEFKDSISRLNWLGIITVQQLNKALDIYSTLAKKIASNKLSNYRRDDSPGSFKKTIAIFYICYAILLSEHGTEEKIFRYLTETNIGLDYERNEAVQEFLKLKQLLESKHQ